MTEGQRRSRETSEAMAEVHVSGDGDLDQS